MAGSIWINESYVATWITAMAPGSVARTSEKVKTGATLLSIVEALQRSRRLRHRDGNMLRIGKRDKSDDT